MGLRALPGVHCIIAFGDYLIRPCSDPFGLLPVMEVDHRGGMRAAGCARRMNNPMGGDDRREGVPG